MKPAGFYADLAKMNAVLKALDAVVTEPDGFKWVDPTKAPKGLLDAYTELVSYGYANGIL